VFGTGDLKAGPIAQVRYDLQGIGVRDGLTATSQPVSPWQVAISIAVQAP
jgi:hypothetical protein